MGLYIQHRRKIVYWKTKQKRKWTHTFYVFKNKKQVVFLPFGGSTHRLLSPERIDVVINSLNTIKAQWCTIYNKLWFHPYPSVTINIWCIQVYGRTSTWNIGSPKTCRRQRSWPKIKTQVDLPSIVMHILRKDNHIHACKKVDFFQFFYCMVAIDACRYTVESLCPLHSCFMFFCFESN